MGRVRLTWSLDMRSERVGWREWWGEWGSPGAWICGVSVWGEWAHLEPGFLKNELHQLVVQEAVVGGGLLQWRGRGHARHGHVLVSYNVELRMAVRRQSPAQLNSARQRTTQQCATASTTPAPRARAERGTTLALRPVLSRTRGVEVEARPPCLAHQTHSNSQISRYHPTNTQCE